MTMSSPITGVAKGSLTTGMVKGSPIAVMTMCSPITGVAKGC
jgi:hypothetical protein